MGALLALPIELRHDIYVYLHPRDLLILSLTCRVFYFEELNEEFWKRMAKRLPYMPPKKHSKKKEGRQYVISILDTLCESCGYRFSPKYQQFDSLRLCKPCQGLPQFTVIGMGKAKSRYMLDNRDVSRLRHITKTDAKGLAKRYYLLKDVQAASEEKLDRLGTTLEEERRKAAEAFKERKRRRAKRQEARRQLLAAKLAKYGLVIPEASDLCAAYIRDDCQCGSMTLEYVIQETRQDHLLFDHTNYLALLGASYERFWDEFEDEIEVYEIGGREIWAFSRVFAHRLIENEEAMEERAMELLEETEKSDAYKNSPLCACGRRILQAYIPVQPYRMQGTPRSSNAALALPPLPERYTRRHKIIASRYGGQL
ncbi:hypothetical protein BZG36_01646 [Bifiguratus adelaidae]|uniref:F-box domain-containing protein n=1 Tax=Bifiguratus adelaidae TaxID=1938954 RepID=A0A261Y494_9FUNG|nr:hypothetical protein BZG36_01646 [Bifiguratus adelaidae]